MSSLFSMYYSSAYLGRVGRPKMANPQSESRGQYLQPNDCVESAAVIRAANNQRSRMRPGS